LGIARTTLALATPSAMVLIFCPARDDAQHEHGRVRAAPDDRHHLTQHLGLNREHKDVCCFGSLVIVGCETQTRIKARKFLTTFLTRIGGNNLAGTNQLLVQQYRCR
jgi:hypothetical protein